MPSFAIISSSLRVWETTEEGEEVFLPWVVIRELHNSENVSSIDVVERITSDCFLNRFKNKSTLSVIQGDCEDPGLYFPKDIILEFRNCVLVKSRIAMGGMHPSDVEVLDMQAVIDCDAFGRFDKKEFVPFDSQSSIKACISCGQLYNLIRFLGGCPSCGSPQE